MWYFTFREYHRLRVYENRMTSKIFGTKRRKQQEVIENCIITSFMI
jgi:hypothetical protein